MHADEAAVADHGAVDDRAVADGAAAADHDRRARLGVDDDPVLDARLGGDRDPLDVATEHGSGPHGDARLEHDVADDRGPGVDEHAGVELGYLVTESVDGHAPSIAERTGGGPHEVRARRDQDEGPRGSDQVLRTAGHALLPAPGADQGQGDAGVHGAGGRQLRHRARLQLGQGRRLPRRRALRPLRLRDGGHGRRPAR